MSGGVDSSVAAALLLEQGHEVVGATMKLWGGPSDSGCCSVADVEDASRVCQQLGIAHHVFNFTSEFERDVVAPYVAAHAEARTPNPCIACNSHLKFDRFLERARLLGFDFMATGHHARVSRCGGEWELRRGRDAAKDQSYVLYMLGQDQLEQVRLPIGELTKADVRALAAGMSLRTAAKPDSQDVCFISRDGGRERFLAERIQVRPGRLVSKSGDELGQVDALELVTIGQRRGLGLSAPSPEGRRYVVEVDLSERTATVGDLTDLLVEPIRVAGMRWVAAPAPAGARVQAQLSAHGRPVWGRWEPGVGPAGAGLEEPARDGGEVVLDEPARRAAPGQAVVLYRPGPDGDIVLGGGTAL
jgi:tRNA-uridine 2-sulfurtransferase